MARAVSPSQFWVTATNIKRAGGRLIAVAVFFIILGIFAIAEPTIARLGLPTLLGVAPGLRRRGALEPREQRQSRHLAADPRHDLRDRWDLSPDASAPRSRRNHTAPVDSYLRGRHAGLDRVFQDTQ